MSSMSEWFPRTGKSPVPIKWGAAWAPHEAWMFWRKEQFPAPCELQSVVKPLCYK